MTRRTERWTSPAGSGSRTARAGEPMARRCCSCTGCRGARRRTTRSARRSTPRIACSASTSAGTAGPIARRARTRSRTTAPTSRRSSSGSASRWRSPGTRSVVPSRRISPVPGRSSSPVRPARGSTAVPRRPRVLRDDDLPEACSRRCATRCAQLHDDGAGRDEVRAALLDQPTPTGGDLADEATPATHREPRRRVPRLRSVGVRPGDHGRRDRRLGSGHPDPGIGATHAAARRSPPCSRRSFPPTRHGSCAPRRTRGSSRSIGAPHGIHAFAARDRPVHRRAPRSLLERAAAR